MDESINDSILRSLRRISRAIDVYSRQLAKRHSLQAIAGQLGRDVSWVLQAEQLGTGHAAMIAMQEIPDGTRDAVILCGDTPLIRAETVRALIEAHRAWKTDLTRRRSPMCLVGQWHCSQVSRAGLRL